jgi:hypothetical protein
MNDREIIANLSSEILRAHPALLTGRIVLATARIEQTLRSWTTHYAMRENRIAYFKGEVAIPQLDSPTLDRQTKKLIKQWQHAARNASENDTDLKAVAQMVTSLYKIFEVRDTLAHRSLMVVSYPDEPHGGIECLPKLDDPMEQHDPRKRIVYTVPFLEEVAADAERASTDIVGLFPKKTGMHLMQERLGKPGE